MPANVTAVFQTIPRYPKCLNSTQNATCLAPQNGAIASGGSRNNYCTNCLDDVASKVLTLSTIVKFYDFPGAKPWDTSLYPLYRLFPATNHHSPYSTFLPLVTIPRLSGQTVAIDLLVPTLDEDGAERPVGCYDSYPTTPCSNVNFSWGLAVNRSASGLVLNFHSDGTSTLPKYGGGWVLSRPPNGCPPIPFPRAAAATAAAAVARPPFRIRTYPSPRSDSAAVRKTKRAQVRRRPARSAEHHASQNHSAPPHRRRLAPPPRRARGPACLRGGPAATAGGCWSLWRGRWSSPAGRG